MKKIICLLLGLSLILSCEKSSKVTTSQLEFSIIKNELEAVKNKLKKEKESNRKLALEIGLLESKVISKEKRNENSKIIGRWIAVGNAGNYKFNDYIVTDFIDNSLVITKYTKNTQSSYIFNNFNFKENFDNDLDAEVFFKLLNTSELQNWELNEDIEIIQAMDLYTTTKENYAKIDLNKLKQHERFITHPLDKNSDSVSSYNAIIHYYGKPDNIQEEIITLPIHGEGEINRKSIYYGKSEMTLWGDSLVSISLNDTRITLESGIKVGQTKDDIIKILGYPSQIEYSKYIYKAPTPHSNLLYIKFNKDVVTSISWDQFIP